MKRILIVGAGFLQTYIIKKAKKLGYYVIAIDGSPNANGFIFADEHEVIDITDTNKCLLYAKKKNIDGVVTGATDYGVITTAYIAKELNLPGLDLEVATNIKNKYTVSHILMKNDISLMTQLFYIESMDDLKKIKKLIIYPVVVKPVDGSGSRGVHVINSVDNLNKHVMDALSASNSNRALIQDFVDGEEYGADIFVYKNKIIVYGPIGKMMTEKPNCAELGHFYPTKLDVDKIKKQIIEAIKELKINFGAVNMDFIVDKNQHITIIDIGARSGGNCISSHIIPLAFNDDYIGNLIRISLGVDPIIETKYCYNVLTRILALNPGVVDFYDESYKNDRYESNVVYQDHINKGNIIKKYENNLDGMGYVILYGNLPIEKLYKDSEIIMEKINDSIRRI